MSGTAIEVKQITHTYAEQVIVDKISFTVPQGAFFIIIGPNGSGKSTLMKIMTGNIKLQKGDVTIQGKNIRSYSRPCPKNSLASPNAQFEFSHDSKRLGFNGALSPLGHTRT